jgi:hypothetical protein
MNILRFFRWNCTPNSLAAGRDLPLWLEESRPVVFMHIPKTSGTAVSPGLGTALAPAVEVGGFDYSLFGSFRDFDTLDESVRCHIHASSASLPKNADLVTGHIAFSTLREAYPLAQYLTILREPSSRLLSHWLFWRQHTDEDLAPWGDWGKRVRQSRMPLVDFLAEPQLACQTDNIALRMLLWPHPLLPEAEFIDSIHTGRLVRTEMSSLLKFNFVVFVKTGTIANRLQRWLDRPFTYDRHNETNVIPQQYRTLLHRELTPDALDLLDARTGLDFHLWARIATDGLPDRDVPKLRERTILANVARYSLLMAC